jgi:hypothetical protein
VSRPELRLVGGSVPGDPVIRRLRFERAHPEAVVLPPCAGRWRAVLLAGLVSGDGTRTTLGAWDLCDLREHPGVGVCATPAATAARAVGGESPQERDADGWRFSGRP